MTRKWLVAILVCLLAGSVTARLLADDEEDADAAISGCSPYTKVTDVTQEKTGANFKTNLMDIYGETTATNSEDLLCVGVSLKAEPTLNMSPGGMAESGWMFPSGYTTFIYAVPTRGLYEAKTHHFARFAVWFVRDLSYTFVHNIDFNTVDFWFNNKEDFDEYEEQLDSCIGDPASCEVEICPGGCTSPLVINLPGDGFKFSGLEDPVSFDINADGIPDRVGWTRFGSNDVFLARDRNHNGRIDDGSELFGNHTPVTLNAPGGSSMNGFEVLRFFESPLNGIGTSAADNKVDSGDPGFNELLLWRDVNHDGISQPEEIVNAAAFGLTAIDMDYHEARRHDNNGNWLKQIGKSYWNVSGHTVMRQIVDVWFATDHQ